MKRVCNENERQLLLKNHNCLLTGIEKLRTGNSIVRVLGCFFVGMIIGIAGCAGLVSLDAPEWLMWTWFGVSVFILPRILSAILGSLKAKKRSKAFLKKEQILINGATVVGINEEERLFSYVEDDFADENGKPIILDYPALSKELLQGTVNRLLVMYDGPDSFQLMAVNEELKPLIPSASNFDLESMDLTECKHLPHPNALHIAYEERDLTEGEKETFAEAHVKNTRADAMRVMKICSVVLVVAALVLCVALGYTEKEPVKYLPYGVFGCVGIIVFLYLASLLGKKNLKRQARFDAVKEVVFHSYLMKQTGQTVLAVGYVYEWVVDHFEVVPYQNANMSMKTAYGTVLYKLTNEKGKAFFIPKK